MKAKILIIMLLVMLLLSATALAAKPIIKADQQYLDINTGLYILNRNVYIEIQNRIITAGQAKVSLSSLEVWGSGGITVTQDDIYFSGNSVYVSGSQEQSTLNGNIKFSRPNIKITSDQVEYKWKDRIAVFSGNVQVTQDGNCFTTDSLRYNVETNTIL